MCMLLIVSLLMSACSVVEVPSPTWGDTTAESPTGTAGAPTSGIADTPPTDSADKIESYLSELPALKYDGETFVIMTEAPEVIDGAGDGKIAAAMAKRNQMLSERYGLKIMTVRESEENMLDKAKLAMESDGYFTDLLLLTQAGVGNFAKEGYLLNIRSVPYVDITKDYFYKSSVDAASAEHRVYGIAGMGTVDRDSLPCLYFSTYRAEQLDFGDMYDLVESGNWTWDKYFECTAALVPYNDNRVSVGSRVIYAVGTDSLKESIADAVFTSMGVPYVNASLGTVPALGIDAESGKILADTVKKMLDDQYFTNADNVADMFIGGEVMFYIDTLGSAGKLRDSSYNWSVMPLPKTSESDGYATHINADAPVMLSVMVNSVDAAKCGTVISALNAASYDLDSVYIKNAMNTALRDHAAAKSMSIIMKNVTFSFADVFGEAHTAIGNATYKFIRQYAVGNAYVGTWEGLLTAAENDIGKIK